MNEALRQALIEVARLGAWLAILSLIFVPLEQAFALHPSKALRPSWGTDLAYYFLSSLLPNLLLIAPLTVLAWLLHRAMPSGALAWAAHLPGWARILATLLVGEIGFYWGHRWTHEVPFLWRFHAVHHSPDHVDWLVNTRAHPVDMVFTRLCGLIPVYILGLTHAAGHGGAETGPVLLVLLGTVWGFFIHANVSWRLGPLEWLVATPAFHHWHHTNCENRDRNYATLLPVLDRLFGTYHLPKHWPPNYGIDATMPSGLGRQLWHPLSARESKDF